MKVMIITVAGMSTRFSESIGGDSVLKCVYNTGDIKESLLYRMLDKARGIDYYVIIGGYLYNDLKRIIEKDFLSFKDKIILINNKKYKEYGSGYSLYKGIERALEIDFDELIFAEGDLFFDDQSIKRIVQEDSNVISINREPINANKAVVLYQDIKGSIHYLYDTTHEMLRINEPFLAVYNSGQVWKFVDKNRVKDCFLSISEERWKKTNLEFVQAYFECLSEQQYEIVEFKEWINCNTIVDYNRIKEIKQ